MIILKLQGGLGNQMFQYAFARKIQSKLGGELVFDVSDYKYDKQRIYSLEPFVLTENIRIDHSGIYNKYYDQRTNYFIKLMIKLIPGIAFYIFSKFGIYIWDKASYREIDIKKRERIFVYGYWQSSRYFDEISKIIKKELKVKAAIGERNKDVYDLITNFNSVCVHIRRGDFLLDTNDMKVYGLCYFKKAMEVIESQVENPKFFLFSDDMEEVKKSFAFQNHDIYYVDKNNKDFEELQLMYQCKHFIISNSTFSWWAQYLGEDKDKIVIAPSVWHTKEEEGEDIIMDSWILLTNDNSEG